MNILAFDHGTNTGWCVLELKNNELKLIDKGIIKMETHSDYYEFYNAFGDVFKKYEKNCPFLCLEKVNIAGAKFGYTSVIRLTEIRTILKLLGNERAMEIIEVNPMTLKKYMCDTSKVSKSDVANKVSDVFDIEYKEIVLKAHTKTPMYDIADSIAIGYYGASQVNVNENKGISDKYTLEHNLSTLKNNVKIKVVK